MRIGYVRVSDAEQNPARQEVLMEQLGVEMLFLDKASGKDTNRPDLQRMMAYVRKGDTVIVESISRFARNTKDLLELVEQLHTKEVQFISQKEKLDTDTPAGRFMLTIFGAVAELEREYIRQRQREGIDIAKQEGKYKGRKPKRIVGFEEVYQLWKNKDITATESSRRLGISRSTFYRKVDEYNKKGFTREEK